MNYFDLFDQPISHPGVQQLIQQYQLVDEFKNIQAEVESQLALEIPNYVSKRAHLEHHQSRFSCIVDELSAVSASGDLSAVSASGDFRAGSEKLDTYIGLVIGLSASKWTHDQLGPEHVKRVDLLQFWHNFTGVFPAGFDPKIRYPGVKLGVLISKGKEYFGGYSANFLLGNFEVSSCYAADYSFAGLTIKKIAPGTLLKMQFDASLKQQNTNIDKNFCDKIPALLATSPVIAWQLRCASGDDCFTDAGLAAAGQIIHCYLDLVDKAAKKNSATQVMSAVRQVVKGFNKLNKLKTSRNMIETNEREDLVPFIVAVAKAAGMQIPEGFDITLAWRDW